MAETDSIADVLTTLEGAWNDLDAAAFARAFASDAIYVTRGGVVWRGRPAIQEAQAKAMAGPAGELKMSLQLTGITMLAPTVALAVVDVMFADATTNIHGVTTLVLTLDQDHWLIASAHTSEVALVH